MSTTQSLIWLHPPEDYAVEGDCITVTSRPRTDFWRKTHNGKVRDNGHFYYVHFAGDFEATVKVTGDYQDMYDHAGLMVRLDTANWIKCGIELADERLWMSAVYTRDYSDWAVVPTPEDMQAVWLRLTRKESTIEVHYSFDGSVFLMLRQGYLTSASVDVGVMVASPTGEGFTATFEGFSVRHIG